MANVLVIAPHPDDESIGCGGSLRLHALRGDRIRVVYLTSGELGLPSVARKEAWRTREAEAEAAAAVLGIAQIEFLRHPDGSVREHVDECVTTIESILQTENVATIYVPHGAESHPDHQAAAQIARTARTSTAHIRFFEIWTPLTTFDEIDDITGAMDVKMKAIRCHRSQVDDIAYDRAIAGLNQYRGLMGPRCDYAEAFQVLRQSPESSPPPH